MSPTWTTFLFEAANFLVLAGALGWRFFRPVRKALADYRDRWESQARQAAEQLSQAEQTRQAVQAERAGLQAELEQLRSRELESARKSAQQILADAHAAAERELEAGRRQARRLPETQQDSPWAAVLAAR
ncbi:MAG: hypothetical protein J5I93_08405 [Pirellulaceae bacterium]|nr:hypothetical protein [Pirellulaceae bacterium]